LLVFLFDYWFLDITFVFIARQHIDARY